MPLEMYVCEQMPNLKLRVVDGDPEKGTKDVVVKFQNKVLQLDSEVDAVAIAALDELIATKDNVKILVKKANMDHAVALVREHQARMDSMPGQVKGPMTAAHSNLIKLAAQQDHLRIQMKAEGATDAQIEQAIADLAADSNLIVAEKVAPVVVDDSQGVIKTPEADVKRQIASAADTRVAGPRPNLVPPAPKLATGPRPPLAGNVKQ